MAIRTPRPDLAAMEVSYPGYIGDIIMPWLNKPQRSGTQYFQDIQTDETAQTGRAADGEVSHGLTINGSTAYALGSSEKVWDEYIPEAQINEAGGLAVAQQNATHVAKRAVMALVEADVVTNTFGNSSLTKTTLGAIADLFETIDGIKESMLDKIDGKIALFGSKYLIDALRQETIIKERMLYTGVPTTTLEDVRGIRDNQLAACLGVDMILKGRKDLWYTASASYQDMLGLVVLPSAGMGPQEELQFGRTLIYGVDGATNNIEINTFAHETKYCEVVGARAWSKSYVFNTEGCQLIDSVFTAPTV